jgi:hypothetical protein
MGVFDRLVGRTPKPIQLDETEASALYDVLSAVTKWRSSRGQGELAQLKTARRTHRPVLERLDRRLRKRASAANEAWYSVQGLSRIETSAVWAASRKWCGAWEPESISAYYNSAAVPEHYEAWVAMERIAHLVGKASVCSACGNAIVPPQASPASQAEYDHAELNRTVELLKANMCSTCYESRKLAEVSAAEARRRSKAGSDAARIKQYRSETSGVADLVQQEMEVLHDLLAIFATPENELNEAEFKRQYVEWWYENQCVVPEITERLQNLSSSRVLSQPQADQLVKLLRPVASLLKNPDPLLPDEITARIQIGYDVILWHPGGGMRVLVRGDSIRGRLLLGECYQALGAALGG